MERAASGRRPTILIVEDDHAISAVLRTMMTVHGYDYLHARDGEEALRLAESEPDCIVLDLAIPRVDGAQVMARLAAQPRLREIPVIVLSGYTDTLPPHLNAAAFGVLSKPFGMDALLGMIAEAIAARTER